MSPKVLLYGATGYAGGLIAQLSRSQGLDMTLAGRNESSLATIAESVSLPYRVCRLDDPASLAAAIADVAVVLNCAGSFSQSSKPLVEACLNTGTHYTDIAGEVPDFESVATYHDRAKAAQVMLLPGVGFGVVPTDCLAMYLKQKLPTATKLVLIYETKGGVSQGTAKTVLLNVHRSGVIRQSGQMIPAQPAQKRRQVNWGAGAVTAVLNPWRGDYFTAFHSTGIPTIEVYTVFPGFVQFLMQFSPTLGKLMDAGWVQILLNRALDTLPPGPNPSERDAGKTYVMGIVEDETGQQVTARLEGSEAYNLTAIASLIIIQHILRGEVKPGFQTPASVYGADLVLEIPNTQRFD